MADVVVISGVGGHFPECDNMHEYREKLLRNEHLISDAAGQLQPRVTEDAAGPAPNTISRETLCGGKLRHGDKFDNTFFGMHARLAAATDAITRHILETTLEAVLDAGYSPRDLHGTNTAVFMGYHCSESESNFIRESADGFGIMGLNAAMTANRVSYWLDLNGPSFTHATQLVSGVQGLDMAYRALRSGECDRAIVGAASLSYLSELAMHYDALGWLSAAGACRPFDRAADGGVRSEAVVVMLLERRSTAQRMYAEVVYSATAMCCEMSRSELSRIERPVLSGLLSRFYKECGVHPDQIAYVEADGWGVPSVDDAELGALDDALASRRTRRPLLVGSVKGNIGQTEAASGLTSVCKVLVAMEAGIIPATINHVNPDPSNTAISSKRIKVLTENVPMPVDGLVAVNNLGLGGMLGHILLRANPRAKRLPAPAPGPAPTLASKGGNSEADLTDTSIPTLLLTSGRTPEGLEAVLKVAEANAHDPEYVHLVHRAFSAHIFGHMYRAYTLVPRPEGVPAQIKFFTGQRRPVWFVYSGMGSQWPGMGADLMRLPVFAAAVERCHAALLPLGVDLKHVITTKDPHIYDNILHSFVGIAAVQVGLTDVLRAVGVEPAGIVGHSVGELGCAYADGCITAEQMVLAAHARGQASNETELIPGMMAAVGMGFREVRAMLPESIEVACHNSATSCTLSGPAADMHAFVAELKDKGVFARAVNVSNIAYHSRYIRPAAPRLLELLQGVLVDPKPRSSRWVSTSVLPAHLSDPAATHASAEYFTNNLLSSVFFEEGCDQVDRDALAIEIAPHGLLQAILKRSLSENAVNVALTKRDMPGTNMVLDALGKMYMEGVNPQVANLYPRVETPVSRGTAPLSPLATWDHRDTWPVAFLKAPAEGGPRTELHLPLSLTTTEFGHLRDCRWNGHAVLSPATCLNLVLAIVTSYAPAGRPIILDDIVFHDLVVVPDEGEDEVYVLVQRGSGRFEVSVRGRTVCSGLSTVPDDHSKDPTGVPPARALPEEDRTLLDEDYIYEELGRRGLRCEGPFRSLRALQLGARAVLGRAACGGDRALELEALLQVVALRRSEGRHELHRPHRIQRVVVSPSHATDAAAGPGDAQGEAAAEDALRLDVLQRCASLASATGRRIYMSRVSTCACVLRPAFAPILMQGRAFVADGPRPDGDLLHLAALALQVAASQTRTPLQVAAVRGLGDDGPGSALHDAVLRAAEQHLPDLHVRVLAGGHVGDGAALLVSDAADLEAALAAVRRRKGLLLAELPAGFTPPGELQELLSVAAGRGRYALLKHVVDVDPTSEVLHVGPDDALPIERLSLSQGAVAYVVFRGASLHAVPAAMRALAAAPSGGRAHCVFLQDAAAPAFAVDAPLYAGRLRLGLRVNVLQGGRWGGVHRVHVARLAADQELGHDVRLGLGRARRLAIDGLQVHFLGVNPRSDVGDGGRSAEGLLDYAGVRADGARVMGVCESAAGPLRPDGELSWPVPPSWSDEDAVTVPLAHATALYALQEQAAVRAGERVLVVAGATALGQAAVALLLARGCHVLATARDQRQAAELRERFPHAQFDVHVGTVDEVVRALRCSTGCPQCLDVVLCQGDPAVLRGSVMGILNKYGRLVHVGTDLSATSKCLGMSAFLLSTALYSVSWDWPLAARADSKIRVRDALSAAIQQGHVRPLPRLAARPDALAESPRRVAEATGKMVLSMRGEPPCAATLLPAGRSCLVLGPAVKAVSLVEWLLSSGARHISVATAAPAAGPGRAASSWLARRLALLAAHYGASVRALPSAEIQQLVEAAGQASPLPLGLVLALEPPPALVRALDAATRVPGCTLAVLAQAPPPGAQPRDLDALCEAVRSRKGQGFPGVLACLGDLPTDVSIVPLHQVLRASKNSALVRVDVMQLVATDELDVTEDGAALPNLLPKSPEALRRLGLTLSDAVTQRPLPSLIGGPADRRTKEVPPVFLVGGLSDSPARELGPVARHLMASAVAVTPPATAASVEEAAAAVEGAVARLRPRGPYTLAGRGWGGCVALEAARGLAGHRGAHVTVFLLDASPDALQAAVRPLKNQPSGLQTALLKYLLKLDAETEEQVYRAPDWAAQMQWGLGGRDAVLEAALTCVLRRVRALVDYRPTAHGPMDPKVAVVLVSHLRHHLHSSAVLEVASEVRVNALQLRPRPGEEDDDAASRQIAGVISPGVHVGRSNMQERRALANLSVNF